MEFEQVKDLISTVGVPSAVLYFVMTKLTQVIERNTEAYLYMAKVFERKPCMQGEDFQKEVLSDGK